MKGLFAAFAILALVPTLAGAMNRARFMELNKKGHELANKRDWKGLHDVLIEIGKEMPAPTPIYFLRMASAETQLGNHAAALEWLRRYIAMGLTHDVAADNDLKPLLDDAAWPPMAARMKEAGRAINRTEQVCALPMADLMPEDLTPTGSQGVLVVSSVQHHSLYRVTLPRASGGECALEEVPLPEQARRWPALAVSFDAARQVLWMTSGAISGLSGVPKEDDGKTALLELEPNSGRILQRYDLETGTPALLGDMSISKEGTVFVSDSIGNGVYRLQGDPAKAKLEQIAEGLFSAQTPVLAGDGKRLFVADYAMGIAVINLVGRDKSVSYLPHPEDVAVTGLDGLLLAGDALIGVQNGTEPARIVRYRLNPQQTRIDSAEVIEQAGERLGMPTHATAMGGWIYVTANVGWNKLDDNGVLKTGEQFSPPVLLRFRER